MNSPKTLHIINHTHWDREWFLTSIYTSRWIPRLIDRIEQLVAQNPDFRYLLDGQTLVIEDLLRIAPDYEQRVRTLLENGHLKIGPYYCQPDWQLSSGELLIRNLLLGQRQVESLGGRPLGVGWLVDTFGHISQAPQIHRIFDIDAVFIWRGAPQLTPYFHWRGPDGSELFTVNLFGGYRNLYGVTHAPEVAAQRLNAEIGKLGPFYPTPDLPLFDGYDLEDNPEDPVSFYERRMRTLPGEFAGEVTIKEATPSTFVRAIEDQNLSLPTIRGELNSGKYGATFPGTLSARTYLKIMANDCEHLLFHLVEPLAALAYLCGKKFKGSTYEAWTKTLLQNAVHDCLCGVSIDQVHEKMEDSYRQIHEAMWQDIQDSLGTIMAQFARGTYAMSTNAWPTTTWQVIDDSLVQIHTEGVGIWPVEQGAPLEQSSAVVSSFEWHNQHYDASVEADGTLRLGGRGLGAIVVSEELGDTYSTERGKHLGALRPSGDIEITEKSAHHALIRYEATWQEKEREVTAGVQLWFDPSPIVRWTVDLDSRGTDLRVDMIFEPGDPHDLSAAMPFDIVKRPAVDEDLLDRDLPEDLTNVLLGQRELNAVRDFPFQDVVTCHTADGQGLAILARGLRSYRVDETGAISLTLRRAVGWLTRGDLQDRVGDAGPFFYVPDARCERRVRHEIGVVAGREALNPQTLQRLNSAFQHPPLVLATEGEGRKRTWPLLNEPISLSNLRVQNGSLVARLFNPLQQTQTLSQSYQEADIWGNAVGEVKEVAPHKIVSVRLPHQASPGAPGSARVTLLRQQTWRVGHNMGEPAASDLELLQEKIDDLDEQLSTLEADVARATGAQRLRLQHRAFILQREKLEYQLSLLLNKRKLAEKKPPGHAYLYDVDDEIAAVGKRLNDLRIKRRIFDYVVQAL